jgi:hypothetical protein
MGKRRRRPHHRAPPPPPPAVVTREKAEQLEVVRLYETLGCDVVSFSQPRATMQTEGIADLKVYCRRNGRTWWHEVKAADGVQSAAQSRFQQLVEACGETYVLGGWGAAVTIVQRFGLVAPGWRPVRPGA